MDCGFLFHATLYRGEVVITSVVAKVVAFILDLGIPCLGGKRQREKEVLFAAIATQDTLFV